MTNEDLKKLAEEVLGGEYFIHPTGVFQMIKDDILNRIENALQKVRDETIEECANIVDNYYLEERPTGIGEIVFHIRALKEKKE